MKLHYKIILFLLFIPAILSAQVSITGTITDTKGGALPGANIFIKDSYDGATSDENGKFSFKTEEKGEQVLVVSFISFESQEKVLQIGKEDISLHVSLKEAINKLTGVTITAGSFGASDEKRL